MNNGLFQNIAEFLKREKTIINTKAGIFKDEVCNLVSLEERAIRMKTKIYDLFGENMYKYRGFSNAMKFLKRETSKKIKDSMHLHNITKSMAKESCTNPKVRFINSVFKVDISTIYI